MDNSEHRSIFVRSIDTNRVVEFLRKAGKEFYTYQEIADACGMENGPGFKTTLTSARSIVEREDRVLWGAVWGEGISKAKGAEPVDAARSAIKRMRNTAKRGLSRLACGKYDEYTKEDQVRHNVACAMLGAIGQMASNKSLEKVERLASKQEPKRIGFDETLAMFQQHK